MTVSTLAFYQLAFNGITFGAGTPYSLQDIQGLESLPTIRNQDDDSGYSDGMFSGTDFLGSRTITVSLLVFASAGHSAQDNLRILKNSLIPQASGTTPLQFQLSAASTFQRVNARVRASLGSVDTDFALGKIAYQVTFFCPDPNIYDDTLMTSTLVITNPLGRTYNRIYPLTYGGGSIATYTAVANVGNWTTYPVITLNGPVINPTIGNFTTGLYITLNGTFVSTDVIVIDLASKLITLNGVSARNLITGTSKWFNAPAGTSQFYLTGAGMVASQTVATVAYRSAYI